MPDITHMIRDYLDTKRTVERSDSQLPKEKEKTQDRIVPADIPDDSKQAKLEDVQINRKEEKKITQDDRDEELPAESGFVRRAVRGIERNPQQNWRHL